MMRRRTNKRKKTRTRGGLAYTTKPIHMISNPYIAATSASTSVTATVGGSATAATAATARAYPITDVNNKLSSQGSLNFINSQGSQKGGQAGQIGSPWGSNPYKWPGVDGISGDRNYIPLNEYKTDISRQMISTGPNPPFSVGGKRSKSKRSRRRKSRRRSKRTIKKVGGFAGQDLINVGREFNYGINSAYNSVAGIKSPINPMPWNQPNIK